MNEPEVPVVAAPVVEVNVTERCEHFCFGVYVGSPAVWRIAGMEPIEAEPEGMVVFHIDDCECEEEECWEPGASEWDVDGWGD